MKLFPKAVVGETPIFGLQRPTPKHNCVQILYICTELAETHPTILFNSPDFIIGDSLIGGGTHVHAHLGFLAFSVGH